MNQEILRSFRELFSGYCRSFYSQNAEDQRNIILKEQHTHNVCRNIVRIAEEEYLKSEEILLAEATALFHDIGRFRQYAEYKTFRDAISVNHATLGTTVLREQGVLRRLPEREQTLILEAIKFHNVYALPRFEDLDALLFMKLIRDADKLDIWRVVMEYYDAPDSDKASAVGLGLPDIPAYSEEILSYIFKGRIASLSAVKSLNDFKLLQLSWIYDLNFMPSLKIMLEQNYVNRIMKTLPQTAEIKRVALVLEDHIQARFKDARKSRS
jgi:HD superfamily phosphohydrolase YqeK